ncbi:BREX-2 system adenine-specific DNA-methyltransferase PglX [Microbacterium esteraromaticum]|uniref:site-specific DNA-methyltransferase (adenine-specific) n=1 Tax=Microbacterium esteraromaticum TaxID=57043 RepID=A0A939DY49_9MICO|nr:BREX-2 system adenine-specific DNA-methyltransferase PglX [Microbacterium esteraromaticum]MBN8417201.1 BREX-2 system adenine-specific DNA-methyltransferase PglX [Microbacterium esteraromaticum]
MTDSAQLLIDLKRELKALEADLRVRAEDASSSWGASLREEYQQAHEHERTGRDWIGWRDGEVAQAGVAWIIACVFIRFCEDNGLLLGARKNGRVVAQPWIAAPGDGLERAVENEAAFYAAAPTETSRGWLQQAFGALADLPAGGPLVDREHSAVWHAEISAEAADGLLTFFRRTTPDGRLVHDFRDPDLGTRFLGDLYQDLSDYAKKTYALLQTPIFVEQFILDQTLTPAIKEFGLTDLKVIDPACGSGHFLLGAFERLITEWRAKAPGLDGGELANRALNSVYGVDLNPFAIAISRFRLTVAAIKAAGISTITSAPAFTYHLAIGDSLLGGQSVATQLDLGDGEYFEYQSEDLREYAGILTPRQYHVVVANPPYIQPPDAKLRDAYRARYETCHGKYALSVPFMELLFRLAKPKDVASGAGYVGQITSNSFMKREFGKKLIEKYLSGEYTGLSPDFVELTHIIDTSGAYIPGHGTPTVILMGRPRKPLTDVVRAVLGVRGEPGQPKDPANGLVWRDIIDHVDQPGYDGTYVTVADMPRETYAKFPWSLSGGGAGELKERLEALGAVKLSSVPFRIGVFGIQGADDAFMVTPDEARRRAEPAAFRPLVVGDVIRDWTITSADPTFFPYDGLHDLQPIEAFPKQARSMWPLRTELGNRATFTRGTYFSDGRPWYEWHQLPQDQGASPLSITFAFVATHNHFVLDRGGKVFKQSAPVIKLPEGATEDDHYDLLGVLNSSTACFWLKQVSQNKGNGGIGGGIGDEAWEPRYEFTSTKLQDFPLPNERARNLARLIDETAQSRAAVSPSAALQTSMNLAQARATGVDLGRKLVALQEELDWRMYCAYGLADSDLLAPADAELPLIDPAERAFEIRLARDVEAGRVVTSWFARHKRAPLTDLSASWPAWYTELVDRRLAAIDANRSLRMLEQPEYKRRWNTPSWDDQLADAVHTALLDRLEAPELWRDASGRPLARTAAQVADALRRDERVRELLGIRTGSHDYDMTVEIGKLLAPEAVPGFAPLRYKPAGIEKFRAWQRTWEQQRAEDRGERVDVDVPPKYKPTDFLKNTYWSARGKLDVPKERFVSFPGAQLPDDSTDVYGWAGWDHAERGQAIARLANDLMRAGADDQQLIPLIGALLELQPWLDQWHEEVDARAGVSPASAISGATSALLQRLGIGADTVNAWRPAPATRGRKKA